MQQLLYRTCIKEQMSKVHLITSEEVIALDSIEVVINDRERQTFRQLRAVLILKLTQKARASATLKSNYDRNRTKDN